MAADLHPEWISRLPSSWSYGVTRDGRVFFINEEAKSTTWLHPVSGEAVITGHRKTPDLPTGWEEGFSFEGARCFINHNERKVTCKHPVSGFSSFCSSECHQAAFLSYAQCECIVICPLTHFQPSRSSKKIHNFGKRSNSIRRNPNALVVKSNWLYKQDSTGMKLWKKRWFVLSDMCLYYYRDEKEEGILGSILLPSFRISMLSVDDHINRKYAFKATHPNMRTYYFCTDAAKDMESWMKVMTDAALVHSEPIRSRSLKVEQCGPQDVSNHVTQNHRPVLTRPEIQNNERNRTEADREHHTIDRKQRDAERYGFQKEGAERDRPLTKINSIKLEPDQASAVPADITPDGPNQYSLFPDSLCCFDDIFKPPFYFCPSFSIMSYQTLPRNMPSHRAPPAMPHYGDPGYRTLPRNSMARPDSICSMSPSMYDQAMGLGLGLSSADKRRSMRDDTMWQLYEWQQRQAYTPTRTRVTVTTPSPPSPSHGSLSMYGGYSPLHFSYNPSSSRSEVAFPVYRGDVTIDRRHRTPHLNQYAYPPERRSMPAGIPVQTITAQSLQGKTAKLSRLCEQDKVVRIREDKLQQLHREKHTLETALLSASQEIEMSADNPAAVHSVIQQRDVLQSGLLSTCRELSRVNTELERSWREYEKLEGDVSLAKDNLLEQLEALGSPQTEPPSHQHVHIQKELWRIQDVMEALNKNKSQRHTDTQGHYGSTPISNIHKSEVRTRENEVEDLSAPPRPPLPQAYEPNSPAVPPLPSRVASSGRPAPPPPPHRSPEDRDRKGPDYRLYKSEPELTTVAEVDETNGEDRSEQSDRDPANTKGMSYPVGIVPPRTKSPNMPNSSSINSYVTLRRGGRPDPRMERPHSAVEQLSGGAVEKDSGRSRMSVEEQLERIRRHQQGALREKKKGLHILAGSSCNSPQDYTTHSHSTTSTPDILELEASLREQEVVREQETPAEEIARLKEATHTDHYNMDREVCMDEPPF
uniref:Pleckstrin homology domain containing A5 n=1 Tax=Oncorhynchus kisutch TaxID=8019 RepID=A0A8C7D5T0_ONCKI